MEGLSDPSLRDIYRVRLGDMLQTVRRTLAGPGRGLVVAADEQVAADQLALRARLAVCARDAVDPVVPHRLVLARRVRAALLLRRPAGPGSKTTP